MWNQEKKCLSENPSELTERLRLLIQGKPSGNDTKTFWDQIVAMIDKFLEYK